MLYYCPLESYKERYTIQLAAPKTGWLERNWIREGIPYHRVEGCYTDTGTIKKGVVLDPIRRSQWCFSQIGKLLELLEQGRITSNDSIYFDDFWHLGIEALAYSFHLFGVKPKMYAYLHAQSVDEFDFTYPMRNWMRPFEQGIGQVLERVFVCCTVLKELVVDGGIAPSERVDITGLVYSSEEILERVAEDAPIRDYWKRPTDVVFTSRWDDEKNPAFFLRVMARALEEYPNLQFMVTTSAAQLRSNNPANLMMLKGALQAFPNNLTLRENLTKEQYYDQLCSSKIQINTASQDFVSYTLLEGTTCGCYPLYPNFRSFPEALDGSENYLYEHLNEEVLVQKIMKTLDNYENWSEKSICDRRWIYQPHDDTWRRMAKIMGVLS